MKRSIVVSSFFACLLLVVFTGSVIASLGDPFDGNSLQNPNWVWQNEPDEWDVGGTTNGWLHFVPKVDQNLWTSDTTTQIYQEISTDTFDVETHVVVDYAGDCMVAGLVAYGPIEDDWTTLKFWGRAGDAIIQWQHKQRDAGQVPDSTQPAGRVEAYLRLARDGDNYMAWWKREAGDDWIEVEPVASIALTSPTHIGLFGGICAGAGEATIEYEYFRDLIDPVSSVEPAAKASVTWGQIKSSY